MSSILKALKKLEQEKSLRREGDVDISREILSDRQRPERINVWRWSAIAGGFLLLIALVSIFLITRSPTVQQPPVARNYGTSKEITVDAPAVEKLQPVMVIAPVTRDFVTPAARSRAGNGATGEQIAKPLADKLPAPANSPLLAPLPQVEKLPPPVTAEPPKKTPASSSEHAESSLTVTGIAWNKDSADRLAIINSQPTSTGAIVNGFLVDEILPDRVRFSRGSRSFEISIGKSGNAP